MPTFGCAGTWGTKPYEAGNGPCRGGCGGYLGLRGETNERRMKGLHNLCWTLSKACPRY